MTAPAHLAPGDAHPPPRTPGPAILIVDDHAANRIALEAVLASLGHRLEMRARAGRRSTSSWAKSARSSCCVLRAEGCDVVEALDGEMALDLLDSAVDDPRVCPDVVATDVRGTGTWARRSASSTRDPRTSACGGGWIAVGVSEGP